MIPVHEIGLVFFPTQVDNSLEGGGGGGGGGGRGLKWEMGVKDRTVLGMGGGGGVGSDALTRGVGGEGSGGERV